MWKVCFKAWDCKIVCEKGVLEWDCKILKNVFGVWVCEKATLCVSHAQFMRIGIPGPVPEMKRKQSSSSIVPDPG